MKCMSGHSDHDFSFLFFCDKKELPAVNLKMRAGHSGYKLRIESQKQLSATFLSFEGNS